MITLHVVDRTKSGSSIFLLEQPQMHWAHDHIQSYYVNATSFESSSSNRMQGWSYVHFGRADLAESSLKLKKKKSVTCLNAFASLGDLFLPVTPAS